MDKGEGKYKSLMYFSISNFNLLSKIFSFESLKAKSEVQIE